MRIAFLTSEFATEPSFAGGLAQYLGRLIPPLVERGHPTDVFVASQDECDFDYRGVHVWRVSPRRYLRLRMTNGLRHAVGRRPLVWTQQVSSVAKGLDHSLRCRNKVIGFDVIQAASWMATGFFSVRRPVAPVVVRVSSYSPLLDTTAGVPITADRRAAWQLELATMRRAAAVYAPSRFLADRVSSETGLRVHVIPPPFCADTVVDDSSIVDALAGFRPYLLFFGRVCGYKGVNLLVEAVKPLLQDLPNLHLVVAGPKGDDGAMDLLLSLEHAFRGRVRYLGSLSPEKLKPVVGNAHAVVLPSLMDNLPNTCLEAMHLGRVVIGPNGVSFDELITDGESGILFEPGNTVSLQRAITRAWSMSDEARTCVGQAARARIAAMEPHRVLRELESFYEQVIEENPHAVRRRPGRR